MYYLFIYKDDMKISLLPICYIIIVRCVQHTYCMQHLFTLVIRIDVDRHNGAKDLLLHQLVPWVAALDDRRLDEVAFAVVDVEV